MRWRVVLTQFSLENLSFEDIPPVIHVEQTPTVESLTAQRSNSCIFPQRFKSSTESDWKEPPHITHGDRLAHQLTRCWYSLYRFRKLSGEIDGGNSCVARANLRFSGRNRGCGFIEMPGLIRNRGLFLFLDGPDNPWRVSWCSSILWCCSIDATLCFSLSTCCCCSRCFFSSLSTCFRCSCCSFFSFCRWSLSACFCCFCCSFSSCFSCCRCSPSGSRHRKLYNTGHKNLTDRGFCTKRRMWVSQAARTVLGIHVSKTKIISL